MYFLPGDKYLASIGVNVHDGKLSPIRGSTFGADIFSGLQLGGQNGFLDNYLSDYRYIGDGGTDRRDNLYDGTYRSRTGLLSFSERCPQGIPKI